MRDCPDLAALPADTATLDLADTTVTDDDLRHLPRLTGMEELDLADTQVTDAGLAHLAGLTWLKRIYLDGTDVTDTELR